VPNKIRRKVIKRIKSQCYIDYGSDYSNTIFLAGSGRSGTTWLSEVLNYKQDRRYIFEPFHSKRVKGPDLFCQRQYIHPQNTDQKYFNYVNKVLSGRIRSFWTDKFNRKHLTNKRLIKAIRANLFLKWMHLNFPKMPIIFLIRHPLAVTVSRSKYKGWKPESLEPYLKQELLMQDFLRPFQEVLERSERKYQETGYRLENHLLSWCIENYVVFKQFNPGEIHIVFYEDCCINPDHEIKRLFSYLNTDFDADIFKTLGVASKVSRKDSAITTGRNLVSNWQESLSFEEIEYFFELISLFGFDKIYSQEPMPNSVAVNLLMSK
jgi:hypothetical protein